MKVSVCIGSNKLAIPYSVKDKVGDILEMVLSRYVKHSSMVTGKSGQAYHLRTLDGAILDNGDYLCDVIDNNDAIKIAFGDVGVVDETKGSSSELAEVTSTVDANLPKTSQLSTPPLPSNKISLIPNFHQKFSTAPRQKGTKTPDRFKSRDEIFGSFSRVGARKSLGNSLSQESWFDARSKLQTKQELQALDAIDNCSNNVQEPQSSYLHEGSNREKRDCSHVTMKGNQPSIVASIPSGISGSLVSSGQSDGTSLPPHPPITKVKGARPMSAVIGYVTEFRGQDVTTKKLECTNEVDCDEVDAQTTDSPEGGNVDASSMHSSSPLSSSTKKKKNQSGAVLAPSNTRVIGKMLNITLTKGSSGLGFTITSRDNMADMNSPIYIKNILPAGAAQLDGRLKVMDRLLFVNGVDVSNAKQSEATQLLRQIPIGQQVELVISRQVDNDDDDDRRSVNDGETETTDGTNALTITPKVPAISHYGIESIEDHQLDGRRLHQANSINSSRQPSMTREMEKFLSSSKSPPCQEAGQNIKLLEPRRGLVKLSDSHGSRHLMPSKSAPNTPLASKLDCLPLKVSGYIEGEEYEEDHSAMTFDRKGFGRQSVSEKRKGHIDPRMFDLYQQITLQKKSNVNDGGTSYATWDSRKAARMRKAAATATNKVESSPSTYGEKQYKSLEELSANQEQSKGLIAEPSINEASDSVAVISEEGRSDVQKEDVCGNRTKGHVAMDDSDSFVRTNAKGGKTISRLCKDKKLKTTVAQEHREYISEIKKTVENSRKSVPFNTTPSPSPRTNFFESQNPLCTKNVSSGNEDTPSPDGDLEKNNSGSSLKFAFRSLPKKLSKATWPSPVLKAQTGESNRWASPEKEEVVPSTRLQPEGREEGLIAQSHLSRADPQCCSSERSQISQNKTLAHVPVLRVEEVSNIYKDMSLQQRKLNQHNIHSSPQLNHPPRPKMDDLHYQVHQIFHHHQGQHDPDNYIHSSQCLHDMNQQQHQQQQHPIYPRHLHRSQQNFYLPSQQMQQQFQRFDNFTSPGSHDNNVLLHQPQRSYDGSTWAPSSGNMLTALSLKPKPYRDWNSQKILRDSIAFSQPGTYAYSPEMQYKTYVGRRRNEKYVTTLKVNCDDDGSTFVRNSILSPEESPFGYHVVPPPPQHQSLHRDASWTRSARV